MQIYFHSRLWSYLPRVPILVEGTVNLNFEKLTLMTGFVHQDLIYCFYCVFDQVNAGFVSRRDFSHTKTLTSISNLSDFLIFNNSLNGETII